MNVNSQGFYLRTIKSRVKNLPVDRNDVAFVPDDQDSGIVVMRWTNIAWQLGRSTEDRSCR